MDEKTRQLWIEAEENPNFNISGDPSNAFMKPRVYSDTPSFLELPVAHHPEDLEGADVVFVGLPWEGIQQLDSTTFAETSRRPPDPEAVIARSGAYLAPEYLRRYSIHHSFLVGGGFYPEIGQDFILTDHLLMMDYGDVEIKLWDIEETTQRAVQKIGEIVKAAAVPLVFGGDHAIPYPVVKAISDNSEGKIGVINFDAHYDIGLSGPLSAENAFGKIMETCNATPENLVVVGISGGAYNTPVMHKLAMDLGVTIFTRSDIEALGIEEVTRLAIKAAGKGTDKIYVSLDADSMDALSFPAQKYPDPFGLTAWQVRDALRILSREGKFCGFDIACIGPDYDHKGVGALIACHFYIEILKGLAIRKMAEGRS